MKKVLFLLSFFMINSALADQNYFGYSYDTETLPKGAWQIYQWMTHKGGKLDGSYNVQEYQTEFEYGITNNLQASYYLVYNTYFIDNVTKDDEKITNNGINFNGMKLALKYNLVNPYLNDYNVGVAFYVEPGFSLLSGSFGTPRQEYFLETKLLLQKNFLQDRLITVFNVTTEFATERGATGYTDSIELKLSGGATYLIKQNIYVGLEAQLESSSEAERMKNMFQYTSSFTAMENFVFMFGPTIHYAGKSWWGTATFLPQIWGNPYGTIENIDLAPGLNLHDATKYEIRIKFGYNS